ncbi:unnamed protein product [Schistocephalus solidus]|uniref:Uncharacterized protein n=1 Tax=Schistocephalus solidus TaxID=70667 RepID=A0A183SLI8_SCHSO|nr:unnamed protein product [Schistocephalus solidus]
MRTTGSQPPRPKERPKSHQRPGPTPSMPRSFQHARAVNAPSARESATGALSHIQSCAASTALSPPPPPPPPEPGVTTDLALHLPHSLLLLLLLLLLLHRSPVSRQSKKTADGIGRRWLARPGAAPGRTTTHGLDPTEKECHKGHIKKEPLQPDSQSASQLIQNTH